jgi:hypothetical protein
MESDFPEGDSAKLTFTVNSPKEFTLALRRPKWAAEGFTVSVNGEAVASTAEAGSYVEISRTWKSGDVVELKLPKSLRLEPLPDNPQRVAVMWGPLVLAGDLGPGRERGRGRRRERGERREAPQVPVFVAADKPVGEWVRPNETAAGNFRSEGVGQEQDVDLVPFYRLHRRLYSAYWDVFTPSQWDERKAAIAAERERLQKLEAATVAFAQPGEMQAERDVNFQGEETWPVRESGRAGRVGRDWFSFELPVDATKPQVLVVTYHSGQRQREPKFDISIDGERIATQETVKRESPAQFYDAEYAIPAELVEGKEKVTVRFDTTEGSAIGPVFGVRVIRANAQQ